MTFWKYFSYFYQKTGFIIHANSPGDNMHEMSNLVFWENYHQICPECDRSLTFNAPSKICSRWQLFLFLLFFKENKSWYFMWIVCQADDSHEISRLVFCEKLKKKIFHNVVCCSCDWLVFWENYHQICPECNRSLTFNAPSKICIRWQLFLFF